VLSGERISPTKSVIARRLTVFWLDDVAISSGSSLLFFFLAPSPPLALSPSVFKGVRISSFTFYSKENNQ
jgi:hypothetical protein